MASTKATLKIMGELGSRQTLKMWLFLWLQRNWATRQLVIRSLSVKVGIPAWRLAVLWRKGEEGEKRRLWRRGAEREREREGGGRERQGEREGREREREREREVTCFAILYNPLFSYSIAAPPPILWNIASTTSPTPNCHSHGAVPA